ILLGDKMREHLILYINSRHRICSLFVRFGGYECNFVKCPLDLRTDVLYHPNGPHTWHLFGTRSIDAHDSSMRVRTPEYPREEHPGPIDVISISGFSGHLDRTVHTLDPFSNLVSSIGIRPDKLRHCYLPSPPAPAELPEFLRRFRNDRDCLPVPSPALPSSDVDSCRGK